MRNAELNIKTNAKALAFFEVPRNVALVIVILTAMAFGAEIDTAGAPMSDIDTAGALASVSDTTVDVSGIDTLVSDTAAPVADVDARPPRPTVNYTGAALSLVVPGAGQVYSRRYAMGAGFLAAEAIAGGMTIYGYNKAADRQREYDYYKAVVAYLRGVLNGSIDPGVQPDADHVREQYNRSAISADVAGFEARQARYDALNALTWTIGIHLYGVMDALELGGLVHQGGTKDPTVAGMLAAIPFLGLGQLYNGHPSKAGMIIMAQTGIAVVAGNHHRMMNRASYRYEEMRDPSSAKHEYRAEYLGFWKGRYDREFSRRNTYLWTFLVAYGYGILDAVVDAHLSDYQERMRVGPDLSVGMDMSGRVGALLSFTLRRYR